MSVDIDVDKMIVDASKTRDQNYQMIRDVEYVTDKNIVRAVRQVLLALEPSHLEVDHVHYMDHSQGHRELTFDVRMVWGVDLVEGE